MAGLVSTLESVRCSKQIVPYSFRAFCLGFVFTFSLLALPIMSRAEESSSSAGISSLPEQGDASPLNDRHNSSNDEGASPTPLDQGLPQVVKEVAIQLDWGLEEPGEALSSEVQTAILNTARLAIIDQLGGSIKTLTENIEEITDTLKKVIAMGMERRGIALESLKIEPGETTLIILKLRLLPQRISSFEVHFRFKRDTDFLHELTQADELALASHLTAKLLDTPFSDEAWVQRLVREQVELFLSALPAYSGFSFLVLVIPDAETPVYITFLPKEDAVLISRFFLKLRSDTLLNLQLESVDADARLHLSDLLQMPISFVASKKSQIEMLIAKSAEKIPEVALVSPVSSCEIYLVRDEISAVLYIDSKNFRLGLSGRVDVNRKGNNSRFDVKAGALLSRNSDLFFHAVIFPGPPEVRPQVGFSLLMEPKGFLESAYDFKFNSALLRAKLSILPDFYLSAEHYLKHRLREENEYSLTYIYRNLYEIKLITDFKGEVFGALGVKI